MKRRGRRILALGLILLLVMGTGIVNFGGVTYDEPVPPGDKPDGDYESIKIVPTTAGYYTEGDFEVTLRVDGPKVGFDSNFPVAHAFVKGNNEKGRLYHFDPAVFSADNLYPYIEEATTPTAVEIMMNEPDKSNFVILYYSDPDELTLTPVCSEDREAYRFAVHNPNPYDMDYSFMDGEEEVSGTVEADGYDLFYTGDMVETIYWIGNLFSATAESDGAMCKYEVTIEKEWYDASGEPMDMPLDMFWEINIGILGTEDDYEIDADNPTITITPEFDQTVVLSEGSGPEWNVTGTGEYTRGDLYEGPTGSYMGVGLYDGAVITVKNQQVPPPTGRLTIDKEVWYDDGGEELAMKQDDEGVFVIDIMEGEEVFDTLTFTGWEKKSIDLPYGTYKLVERPTEGYDFLAFNPSDTVVLSSENDEPNVTIQNEWIAGSLTINKMVYADDSLDEDNGVTFTFNIEGPNEFEATETIEGNGSVTLTGLEPGTYTVTEVPVTDYFCEDPEQSTLIEMGYLDQELTFSNYYDPGVVVNRLTVTKRVLDVDEEPLDSTEEDFWITVTGPNEYIADLYLGAGESQTLMYLGEGTYTIVENDVPDGYLYGTISDSSVFVGDGNNPQVIVTNLVDEEQPVRGSITILKEIWDGETMVTDDTMLFDVFVSYGEGGMLMGHVGVDNPLVFDNLNFDSYTISENTSSGYDLMDITPTNVVLTENNPDVTVVIRNSVDEEEPPEETYELTIQKRVVNTGGSVISTNTRTFTAVVTGPGEFSQNVTLVGNDTETLTGLEEGTYTVTETAPTNYDLLSITPNSVTLGGEVESATVVITNEYDPPTTTRRDRDEDDNGGGGTTFIDLAEEVEVVEPVPEAPALPERPKVINPPEEEIILDEPIPEAPGTLPQTGEIPPTIFYWFGLVLSGLGFSLRKRR